MPKLKSHSGSKKRVTKTASGRYKCKKSGGRHLLQGKSERRVRRIRASAFIHETMEKHFDRLLPMS